MNQLTVFIQFICKSVSYGYLKARCTYLEALAQICSAICVRFFCLGAIEFLDYFISLQSKIFHISFVILNTISENPKLIYTLAAPISLSYLFTFKNCRNGSLHQRKMSGKIHKLRPSRVDLPSFLVFRSDNPAAAESAFGRGRAPRDLC